MKRHSFTTGLLRSRMLLPGPPRGESLIMNPEERGDKKAEQSYSLKPWIQLEAERQPLGVLGCIPHR